MSSTIPIPVQPGRTPHPIQPAPDGRTHIFDTYLSWQTTPKLTLAVEGDYEIERLWRNTNLALGESSAPSHVAGGAGYAQYRFTKKMALAARAEYLSDRGGLFSGLNQALKETTLTYDFNLADNFLMRYEWLMRLFQPTVVPHLHWRSAEQSNRTPPWSDCPVVRPQGGAW